MREDDAKLLAGLALKLYGGDKELAKAELTRCLAPHEPGVVYLMGNPNSCCVRDKIPMVFPETASEGKIVFLEK